MRRTSFRERLTARRSRGRSKEMTSQGQAARDLIAAGLLVPLAAEEDHELRRLSHLANQNVLPPQSWDRFVELRLRDRRKKIREV